MESASRSGIVDDTEDSDASLLVVNDNDDDEVVTGASDDDANLTIPDAVPSDSRSSNPLSETAAELTRPVSATTSSLPRLASSVSGNATQDAVVVTPNDTNCSRYRRRHHRQRRSVLQLCILLLWFSLLLYLTDEYDSVAIYSSFGFVFTLSPEHTHTPV